MGNERPDLYLKVAAAIVPKELHITSQGVGDRSDEDVLRVIDAMPSGGHPASKPCKDKNLDHYSYRMHELLMPSCIEIESQFKAILQQESLQPCGGLET
jgi:hypothetical protein